MTALALCPVCGGETIDDTGEGKEVSCVDCPWTGRYGATLTRTPRVSDERGYDVESVPLVDAMNLIPGIRTVESCCGHREREFLIWFQAASLDALPALLYWFDSCHCGLRGWRVIAKTDCAMSPVTFVVEGPVGDYEGADRIAALIREDVGAL